MEDLFNAQKDTILGVVNDFFKRGELPCPIEAKVLRKEKVVGELTNYEKAIFSALLSVGESNNDLIDEIKKNENSLTPSSVSGLTLNKDIFEALKDVFWTSLKKRLGNNANKPSVYVGIRKDWKVVLGSSKEPKFISIITIN